MATNYADCEQVVCVKSHSQWAINGVKRNKIFRLQNHIKAPCKCRRGIVDIGVDLPEFLGAWKCNNCGGTSEKVQTGIWWFAEELFAPLTKNFELSETTVEDLIEENIEA